MRRGSHNPATALLVRRWLRTRIVDASSRYSGRGEAAVAETTVSATAHLCIGRDNEAD